MTQQRRSFGRIAKKASGRFQASYIPTPGSARVTAPRTFATKRDASRWLNDVETDLRRGTLRDPRAGAITWRSFGERFLADHTQHLAPTTPYAYERLWANRVGHAFDGLLLREITTTHARAWVASLTRTGVKPPSVRQAFRLASLILNAAVADGHLLANPCAVLGRTLPKANDYTPRVLALAEVEALTAAMPEPYPLLVDVLALTGLRIGEAFALRRRSVDPLQRALHVEESAGEAGGEYVVGPTKTHQRRRIALPASLLDDLVAHLDTLPADPDAWLWPSRTGRPLRYGSFRKSVWDPAVERAGIEGRVTPHNLRTTHGSIVAATRGVAEAARRLGHATPATTMRFYVQPVGEDRGVADWLDQVRHARRVDGQAGGSGGA